ncbi:MAG: phage major capsid family protein [Planctomycetota bacterium]|jgi:hypothetical protein
MNTDELETKGGSEPITDPSEIKSKLTEMDEKLTETMAAAKSAANADQVNAEIKSLRETIGVIKQSVEDLPADYSAQIKAIGDQLDAFQTGAGMATMGKANIPDSFKTITEKIMDSAVYKSMLPVTPEAKAQQIATQFTDKHGSWSERTEIPSFAIAGYKAPSPVLISDMAGSDTDVRRSTTVEAREFQMDIMSRIPTVITANAATYTVPRETDPSRYGAWKTTLASAINGDPTPTSTATLTDTEGCMIGSTHRFYNASDVLLGTAVVVSFVPATNVVTYVTNSLDFDATAGWKVTSENYAAIAEQGEKPNGFVGTASESFTLKVLPSIIPTTVNALNTIQGMQALIERKLPQRDRRNMSRHLIYGDGTADELMGLRSYSGAQSYLWSSGVSGDNQVDAVMRSINLIPWGVPISVIMSQVDLPALTLLKGSDGHYLRTGSFGQVPLTQIGLSWFLGAHELVFDFAVTSGHFTPINFSGASEIADQNTAALLWGYSGDDFLKNIIRARYEATRAHAIVDPNEYVVGQWDAAP